MAAVWRGLGQSILARIIGGGDAMLIVDLAADAAKVESGYVTLVANTDATVNIPEWAVGVHVFNAVTSIVFFAVDEVVTVPSGTTRRSVGFFPASQESARVVSNDPIGTSHVLHLRSTGAGSVLVEFWG